VPRTKCFLDLDGTLLDPRKRLHELFQELAPASPLSFDAYWKLKRQRINQRELLKRTLQYDDAQIADFYDAWMRKVEEPHRLAVDVPIPGAAEFLAEASSRADIVVVTARQSPDSAVRQIEKFGWTLFLDDLVVTRHLTSKDYLVRKTFSTSPRDLFIGDTGEDIRAGKALGVRTIAVCSGVLSREILTEYDPDEIVESIADPKALSSIDA
jgi:phosphoglycolate phosphatase